MNQIRTYSKSRPKAVIGNEKEDTIFENCRKRSLNDNDYGSDEDIKLETIEKGHKIQASRRKMRPVTGSKCNPKKLKSTKKSVHQQTPAMKRKPPKKNPLKIAVFECEKTRKFMEIPEKNTMEHSQNKENTKFTWSGSDNDECAETSIEILRKDEGMTWQQKISFLLPKMHQEYTKEIPSEINQPKEKIRKPLLNFSAEEIEEDVSDSDNDYTYTWVTESAANTKSNMRQNTVPSTQIINSADTPSTTLISAEKTPSLKRSADTAALSRTGKLKLNVKSSKSVVDVEKLPSCEFMKRDQEGFSFNQKWNSTMQKDAKNIKECAFPADMSSIRLSSGAIVSNKTELQKQQESTPKKHIAVLAPSRPKKKVEKQLSSTKMFLSDHVAFHDMVPEMSTINKASGKSEDSIEMTREKSPFMKQWKTESPITPFISPKKDNEQVFTSTPTKDKNNKDKEFPEFDLSSVQIPEFDEDELEIHESREVNSQEIVCEASEEEIDVPDPVVLLENRPNMKEVSKLEVDDSSKKCNVTESTSSSHNSTVRPHNNLTESTKSSQSSTLKAQTDKSKSQENSKNNEIQIQLGNISVIPINKSVEFKPNSSKKKHKEESTNSLEECCIAALSVPVKPLKKAQTHIDYQHILRNTTIDCIQQMFS